MKNRPKLRNKDLAKIHIAKKQLGMDEDTYREMLRNIADVESATDLTDQGRFKVLRHLHQIGFKSRKKAPRYLNRPNPHQLAESG